MQVKYYFCISISFFSCSSVRSRFLCSSFKIPILNAFVNSFSCSAVSITIFLLSITTAPLLLTLLYARGNSYAKLVLIIKAPLCLILYFSSLRFFVFHDADFENFVEIIFKICYHLRAYFLRGMGFGVQPIRMTGKRVIEKRTHRVCAFHRRAAPTSPLQGRTYFDQP